MISPGVQVISANTTWQVGARRQAGLGDAPGGRCMGSACGAAEQTPQTPNPAHRGGSGQGEAGARRLDGQNRHPHVCRAAASTSQRVLAYPAASCELLGSHKSPARNGAAKQNNGVQLPRTKSEEVRKSHPPWFSWNLLTSDCRLAGGVLPSMRMCLRQARTAATVRHPGLEGWQAHSHSMRKMQAGLRSTPGLTGSPCACCKSADDVEQMSVHYEQEERQAGALSSTHAHASGCSSPSHSSTPAPSTPPTAPQQKKTCVLDCIKERHVVLQEKGTGQPRSQPSAGNTNGRGCWQLTRAAVACDTHSAAQSP